MSFQLIKKIVGGIPESERKRPAVAVEGIVYRWEDALGIIEKDENSFLAQKVQKKIEETGKIGITEITEDEWKIVEERAKDLPEKFYIGIMSEIIIGDYKTT